MTRTDAKLIREELEWLKAWIHHWETDRILGLVPTESSLNNGKHHADRALALLRRMEAENKEPA